jgi:hypothetical protein
VFYTASASATAQVGSEFIEQTIEVAIKIVQAMRRRSALGSPARTR